MAPPDQWPSAPIAFVPNSSDQFYTGDKDTVAENKHDLSAEIATSKQALTGQITEVRQELAKFKQELSDKITEVKQELTSQIAELKRMMSVMQWMLGLVLLAVVLPILRDAVS